MLYAVRSRLLVLRPKVAAANSRFNGIDMLLRSALL